MYENTLPAGPSSNGALVEGVGSTRVLGVHVLSWTVNTSALAKKTNQCLSLI